MGCENDWLVNIPSGVECGFGLIFAHGAGAGKDHDFMETVAQALCNTGIAVIRFNFPYMDTIKITGKRRPPDKMDVLINCFKDNLTAAETVYPSIAWSLAGKSLGGRVATHLLADSDATIDSVTKQKRSAICFGYPFHPPQKPETLRVENLNAIDNELLILQGTRDIFGTSEEVKNYSLNANVNIIWLEDGDHDLQPRKRSGYTFEQHLVEMINGAHEFLNRSEP